MNRFTTPVNFAFEKNVVQVFGRVTFGANGAPILDTNNSKGICNVALNAVTFLGATTGSSTTVSSISSFQDLFSGMTVTGSAGALQASTTLGSFTAATGSLALNQVAVQTGNSVQLSATGGQYIFQFGQQAGIRLDGYFKLLSFSYAWDESTGSASGTATTLQLAPSSTQCFIVNNLSQVRTIPATTTSNSTDCTISVQLGNGTGVGFSAVQPVSGEVLRVKFIFGNSSAP